MAYATMQDLAEYLGEEVESLPSDSSRLLERASELIDVATMGRVDLSKTTNSEAVKKAACAQVEQWLALSESIGLIDKADGFRIGNFSMNLGSQTSNMTTGLAPRARRFLLLEGLLYRGVTAR